LRKTPVALPQHLWDIFRKSELCRTPEEERLWCFEKLKEAEVEPDFFLKSVNRALKACLQLHPITKNLDFVKVEGNDLNLDVVYSQRQRKVEKKLFTFEGAHEKAFCDHEQEYKKFEAEPAALTDGIFLCNHAVMHLYTRMIDTLPPEEMRRIYGEHAPPREELVSRAWQLLPTMPRGVRVEPTTKKLELKVSWEVAESRVTSKLSSRKLKVTLHRGDVCPEKCDDLLLNEGQLDVVPLSKLCLLIIPY
jgi:hypothetical protein